MPISVHVYTSIDDEEQRDQLERLYNSSPEFPTGAAAIAQLQQALSQYTLLYTAEFNQRIIAAIWSSGSGAERTLKYIVVHPANRGRGVAERLIDEVCAQEQAKNVQHFIPGCGAIARNLAKLGKLNIVSSNLS
ncbi:GNAT family N-acetyltransferase [Acinetobacter sp. MD2(2019)]|uniref:GNAT family N-acetyltransferase n=1 Tax=Acinetobacter sp. MD2(2019) TaxID=2605273 RepID=UPI002D1F1150|nr:GNAT family N-acetyltransferase [Acinetobacter sp. MD2(2019)]MEB3754604.1 acetyl-CoA sensor PanZ family protein [Acinetobacter sp. MD2(2019)]